MANTNTKKTVKSSTSAARKTSTKPVQEENIAAVEIEKPIVAKEIDPTQYVTVLNGYQGKLTYKSGKTGETFRWSEFGDEQEMELRELRNAKNTYKKYFEKNWFMFPDEYLWVIDYLGVRRLYKNAIRVDEFDNVFEKSAEEIKDIIDKLSDGQKKAVAFRANTLISEGKIDSNKVIRTLEEALGVELTEKYN